MEKAVIGVYTPVGIEAVVCIQLETVVGKFSCIYIFRATVDADGTDEVLAVDVEDVGTDVSLTQALGIRELVVHHALWLQLGIGWWEHVHLTDDRITESLADHGFQVGCRRHVEGKSALWNPLTACRGMVVVTDTCLHGQPFCQILTEVHVTGNLILMETVCQVAIFIFHQVGLLSTGLRLVPGRATEVLPVDTEGYPVPLKERGTLVPADSTDVIVMFVEIGAWVTAYIITIVYLVVTPVVIDTQGTVRISIVVRQGYGSQATGNPRVIVQQRSTLRTGVGCVEMSQIHVTVQLPVGVEAVT